MNEYEDDRDDSLRARLRNAWLDMRRVAKQLTCRHRRTHTTKQTNHSGKHYEVVEAQLVTSCSDCGEVLQSESVAP